MDQSLLNIYVNENLIPRGLRLRAEAPFKNDIPFTKDWDHHLHQCGIALLKLLITKRQTVVNDLFPNFHHYCRSQ